MAGSTPVSPVHSGRSGTAPTRFVVFGERNSGTNFVAALLKRNFPSLIECRGDRGLSGGFDFGWKHGFPAMISAPPGVIAVCVFRHPETWVGSLHRKPWHADASLRDIPISDFIRRPWKAIIDDQNFGVRADDYRWNTELQWDRDPLTGRNFANVLKLRNAKNRGFLSLRSRFPDHFLLRYEDIQPAPEQFVATIGGFFSVTTTRRFRPVETERGAARSQPYQPKSYAPLSAADRKFIWSQLDKRIEAGLEYRPAE